jgi:hypothetical protein
MQDSFQIINSLIIKSYNLVKSSRAATFRTDMVQRNYNCALIW